MNAKLISLAGPLKGMIFDLTGESLSIGRDVSNRIALNDKSISRRHCQVDRENQIYRLTDLESYNGTFINEAQVREQTLNHGDRIRVGSSLFLFLLDDEPTLPRLHEVSFDDRALVTTSLMRFRLEEAVYSMTRELNVLMKVGSTINSIKSLQALEHQLLQSLLEIIPAERGAILMIDDHDLEAPRTVYVLERFAPALRPLSVSRTVARQVIEEGVAVMSNEVLASETLGRSESLMASHVRALICVPLTVLNKVIGLVYLDICESEESFTEWHLQIATAIAGSASGALDNVRHIEWLEVENQRLRADIQSNDDLVGEGAKIREVYQFLSRVAPADSTVLIRGESGTGKELAAHALHRHSPRARKPFIAVNCAALTETLLESELFGHEKGSFTGAHAQKKGKLELAEGGTLFLDEVGEMAPALQAKLLRVLQGREFERVGGTRTLKADIRIIAATNKNLEAAIADGSFRRDLYYRLNVVSLTMPPLRERPEDVPSLAEHFIAKYSQKCKRRVGGLSAKARDCLAGYDWPGNVRELENAIERAIVLGSTELIQPEDLPEQILEAAPPAGDQVTRYHEALGEAKRQLVLKALEQAGGNYTQAAKVLGIHPNNIHRLARHLNIKPGQK